MSTQSSERTCHPTGNGSFRASELMESNARRTASVWPVRRHQQIAGKSVAHKEKLQSTDRYQNMTITLGLHESFMSSLGNFSFEGSLEFDSSGTTDLIEERSRRRLQIDPQDVPTPTSEPILECSFEASESSETASRVQLAAENASPLSPSKRRTCRKPPRATDGYIWSSPLRRARSDSPTRTPKLREFDGACNIFDAGCITPTSRTTFTQSTGLSSSIQPTIRRSLSDSPGSGGTKTPPPMSPRKCTGNYGSYRTPTRRKPPFPSHKSPLRRSRSEFPSPTSQSLSHQTGNDGSSCLTPTSRTTATQSTTRHSSNSDLELRDILQSPRRASSEFPRTSKYTPPRRYQEEPNVDERLALERQESEMLRYALNLSLSEK